MVRALEGSAAQDGALAGNPFLVKELLPELGETGTEPVTVERVRSRWGEALRWTADRVGNGPPAWSPVLAPERRVAGDRTAQAVKQLLAGLELARRADPCWAAFQSTTRRFFGTLAWYYRLMAQGERSRLLTEFFTPFLSEAGAMPVQNARKIEALMRSGVLRVRAGGPGVVTDAPDMTVNAIGRARAITPGSGIAGQAIAARIVVPDPLGGIRMDPDSGLALDDDGTLVPDVAVLGPLAVGSYLGASGVYASVKFARLVANRWVTEILDTVGQEVRV